jgi:rod shape-determining protein MreD
MRWIRFTILLLLLTLLNISSLTDYIEYGPLNIKPDLLLILLVFVSINFSSADPLIAAFAIGFAADISGDTMGPATLIYGIFGGMISLIQQVVIMKRMIHQAMVVFVTSFFTGLLIQMLTLIKTGQAASSLWGVVFGTALFSALAAPFVWILYSVLSGWLGVRNSNQRAR